MLTHSVEFRNLSLTANEIALEKTESSSSATILLTVAVNEGTRQYHKIVCSQASAGHWNWVQTCDVFAGEIDCLVHVRIQGIRHYADD